MNSFEMTGKAVETTGKTIEEAVRLALIHLDVESEDEIEYEVIEEGSKGFLGIGAKETRIRATKKNTIMNAAEVFLTQVLEQMKIDAVLEMTLTEDDALRVNMVGQEMAVLIGKRGQTLDSLQYLLSLAVNKNRDAYVRVTLDTENYREKRKHTLENLADRLASKVSKNRRNVILEPMNPYERRIIHSKLQGHSSVSTRSEGNEPYRKVVIYYDHKKSKAN